MDLYKCFDSPHEDSKSNLQIKKRLKVLEKNWLVQELLKSTKKTQDLNFRSFQDRQQLQL